MQCNALHHSESACPRQHGGQRSAAGHSLWSCVSVAGGDLNRLEVSVHTLASHSEECDLYLLDLNLSQDSDEYQYQGQLGRNRARPLSCYGSIWMQTLRLNSENVGVQHPNMYPIQSKQCVAPSTPRHTQCDLTGWNSEETTPTIQLCNSLKASSKDDTHRDFSVSGPGNKMGVSCVSSLF